MTAESADANVHVVLVVLMMSRTAAMLVGPFESKASARDWSGIVGLFAAGCTCHVLPLLPSVLSADTQQDEGEASAAPAVILVHTDDGFVVYGPFDSGMEAAVFWLDVASLLDFTNVRRAQVCDLAPPSHNPFPVRTTGSPDSTDRRVRGWVVRLATALDEPELVGPFDDEHAAHAWQARRTDAGKVAPIFAP